jgi:hypothetical protein
MSIFSKIFGVKPRPAESKPDTEPLANNSDPRKPRAAGETPRRAPPELKLDSHAQPPQALNLELRKARDTNEVLGVLRGLIADGTISASKVIFLGKWLTINSEFTRDWPFRELLPEVLSTIENGCRASDLEGTGKTIVRICGNPQPSEFANRPSQLPFSTPAPEVIFPNKEFVLTGRFEFGPRSLCQSEITSRGGTCGDSISKHSNYLIIGNFSSRDWSTSAWGNKILKAVEYSARGTMFIISEDAWRDALGSCPVIEEHTAAKSIPASKLSSQIIICADCRTKFVHRVTRKERKIFCPSCQKEVRI